MQNVIPAIVHQLNLHGEGRRLSAMSTQLSPPPYKLEFIQCYPLPQNKTEVMLFCLFEKIGCIPNVEMQMIKTGIPQSDPSVAGGLDIFIIPH